MGATIGDFDKYMNEESAIQAFTTDKLSNAIVRVMDRLTVNEEIFKLLYYEDDVALNHDFLEESNAEGKRVFDKKLISKQGNEEQRILPYPFDFIPAENHKANIRVYFNQGSFSPEGVMARSQMNIDIIVSHGLWLTSDPNKKLKIVRIYALMSRIIEELKKEKINKLPVPSGYTQLTVNEEFECIRIYANLDAVE